MPEMCFCVCVCVCDRRDTNGSCQDIWWVVVVFSLRRLSVQFRFASAGPDSSSMLRHFPFLFFTFPSVFYSSPSWPSSVEIEPWPQKKERNIRLHTFFFFFFWWQVCRNKKKKITRSSWWTFVLKTTFFFFLASSLCFACCRTIFRFRDLKAYPPHSPEKAPDTSLV